MGTVWVSMLPTPKLLGSMSWRDGAPWAPFFTLVVCWRGQQLLSFIRMLPSAHLLADEAIFRGLRKTPAHRGEQPPGGVNRRPEEAFCWVEPIRSSTSRPLQPATSRCPVPAACAARRSAAKYTREQRHGRVGMPRRWTRWVTTGLATTVFAAASVAAETARLEYDRDVRPILSENCFPCHGQDSKKRMAGLRLDTFEGATADRNGHAALTPGRG